METLSAGYMHPQIADLAWEALLEHQIRHGWPIRRTISIADLIDDLMAAYDELADVQPDTTHHESEGN